MLESLSDPPSPANGAATNRETFLGVLSAAAVELLAHYRITVQSIETSDQPEEIRGHQVAGIIGFANASFGGTVALRSSSALVRACLPIPSATFDVNVLGDWIAELTNQLIGRTKNKFLRSGTSFQITPPTYAVADDLLVLGCDCARTSWLSVTTTAGPLLMMLELHTAPDFTFLLVDNKLSAVQAEGELTLF